MRVLSLIVALFLFCSFGFGEDVLTREQKAANKSNEIFFKNCELIMNQFGLKQLKLTPCNDSETVRFFKDSGSIAGKTYTLEGAELVGGPGVGVRCAYAKALDSEGNICPKEVEVALHIMGKFRYCLWGGDWMCRKTYEGECLKNEDGTFDAPWGWNKGSTIEKVNLPLPENVKMEKITSSVGVPFITVSWFTKKTIKARVPKIIMRDQLVVRSVDTTKDCDSCIRSIDPKDLTEQALRERKLIGDNQSLAKVLYAEDKTKKEVDTNVTLMEADPVVIMVDTVEEKCFVRTTVYPIDNE
jgi:hypothetical protein